MESNTSQILAGHLQVEPKEQFMIIGHELIKRSEPDNRFHATFDFRLEVLIRGVFNLHY